MRSLTTYEKYTLLTEAMERIRDKRNHTKGWRARDKWGHRLVRTTTPSAVRWCATGTCERAALDLLALSDVESIGCTWQLCEELSFSLPMTGYIRRGNSPVSSIRRLIENYNDRQGHAAMFLVFERTVRRLRRQLLQEAEEHVVVETRTAVQERGMLVCRS